MKNDFLKLLTNPDALLYKAGYLEPTRGYISPEARAKARAKRKKKKK